MIEKLQAATGCPECNAAPDAIYGWYPIVRHVTVYDEPHFVVEQQCFECGRHQTEWISLEWSREERYLAGIAFWLAATGREVGRG